MSSLDKQNAERELEAKSNHAISQKVLVSGSSQMQHFPVSPAGSFLQAQITLQEKAVPCFQLQSYTVEKVPPRSPATVSFALPFVCKEVNYVTLTLYLPLLWGRPWPYWIEMCPVKKNKIILSFLLDTRLLFLSP